MSEEPKYEEPKPYGPEWHAAVEPEWRLGQIYARLFEVEKHLEALLDLKGLQPAGLDRQLAALERKIKSAQNIRMNAHLRHAAYQRRVSGQMTEGEKRDYDLRQTLKPGGRPPGT